MKVQRIAGCAAAAALAVALASCATVSKLHPAELVGARLAAQMTPAPQPRVHVAYDVTLSSRNPIFSALSVMTNLAKAAQAQKADQAMREALDGVDVPAVILAESSSACATALGASEASSRSESDLVLMLHIHDWGIEADSPASSVDLHMSITAGLYRSIDNELLWQRRITVNQPASPAMFGAGQIVGNMITATALYEMSADELSAGFREMARETSRAIVRALQREIDRAQSAG